MPYVGCTGDLEDFDAPDHEQCWVGEGGEAGETWNCVHGDPPWVCPEGIKHFGYTPSDIAMFIAADTERDT